MNSANHSCDSIQREISSALDEGSPLPSGVSEHVARCPECGAFLDMWTGPLAETLSRELPLAGVALRHRILALPGEAAPMPVDVPRRDPLRSVWRFVSAVAAVLAVSFAGYSLIEIRPVGTGAANPREGTNPVANAIELKGELAALEDDFKSGVGELHGPMRSLQLILNQ